MGRRARARFGRGAWPVGIVSPLDPQAIAGARELLARAAAPAPAALELLEHACDCREGWDPAFERARTFEREIAAGIRDPQTGRTADAVVRSENRGRYNAGWRCPSCNKIVGRKRGECPHCGVIMGSVSCPEALDTR
jgi:rubrerythrin